jgi:hypothetical protein
MRIKSRWFKDDAGKSPAEQASAMAFVVFRVAHQMVKRLRAADYDVDAGTPYFQVLREALVYFVALTDRMAYARLDAHDREAFTVALVRHLARHVSENEREFLGTEGAATNDPAQAERVYADRFVDLVNEVLPHYGEFGAAPRPRAAGNADAADGASAVDFEPDFAFVRYFGSRLEPALPPKDRRWVLDQVMAIEAPEALEIIRRAMHQLHDTSPHPRRAREATTGE